MDTQDTLQKTIPELRIAPRPAAEILQMLTEKIPGLHPLPAGILWSRGYRDFASIKAFMQPALPDFSRLPAMKGMRAAVARITAARAAGEKILVYGDYDVDGTCATAVMYSFLKKAGASVESYNPDRYLEGYGISRAGIEFAEKAGHTLLITLDCGIAATDRIAEARAAGIDVIVCDHHTPGEVLPRALAVLNPKQKDCPLYGEELCGCGVAFLLIRALCEAWSLPERMWREALPLTAVATCCDIVDLIGMNRGIVKAGLTALNENPPPGIAAMLQKAGYSGTLSVADVVFKIGPRINAAGRLAHAREAVQLLISPDTASAAPFAERLEALNRERRILDKEVTAEAAEVMTNYDPQLTKSATVVKSDNWHKGVIGITASRLTEICYRPAVVFTEADGALTGSARSVEGFDLYAALKDCEDLFSRFGGHKAAAGLSLPSENFEAFRARFEQAVEARTKGIAPRPAIDIDAEADFSEWYDGRFKQFFNQLNRLKPYGPKNREPLFLTRECRAEDVRIVGTDHLRFKARSDGAGRASFPVIAFRYGHLFDTLSSGAAFSMVYTIGTNEWNGRISLQLEAKDIRPEKAEV